MVIKVTFLGTSATVPTEKRNHTAVLLNYNGENILVDCGEGTQRQFRKAKLNPCSITRMLITHWHGDHVLGIPGMLQTLALNGYNKTLNVYGPRGTEYFMNRMMSLFIFRGKYSAKINEVGGKFFEAKDFSLEAKPMTHGTPCNAYLFIKKGQRRIDKNKLKKAKLPSLPMIQKLKEGKDITYKGKRYKARDLTYKEDDKRIAFVFDTSVNESIIPLVKNADLLICEATHLSDSENGERLAKEHKHLTSKQAAEIAKKAKVKKLILTHISQRYEAKKKKILDEAKKVFANSFLAEDLESFEID